jgi:plasmid stabilization system protein ParE
MKNTYKIIWSDTALNGLKSIISYLERNWTEKEIKHVAQKLEKTLDLIQKNPNLFPTSSRKSDVKRSVISKQVSLYYSFDNQAIYIVNITDNRMDPGNIKLD